MDKRNCDPLFCAFADLAQPLRLCSKNRPVRGPGLQWSENRRVSCRPRALTRRFRGSSKQALRANLKTPPGRAAGAFGDGQGGLGGAQHPLLAEVVAARSALGFTPNSAFCILPSAFPLSRPQELRRRRRHVSEYLLTSDLQPASRPRPSA